MLSLNPDRWLEREANQYEERKDQYTIDELLDEIAALKAELARYSEQFKAAKRLICEVEAVLFVDESARSIVDEAKHLRAELAKYTGDLTDEQADSACNLFCGDVSGRPLSSAGIDDWKARDTAIREVRGK